MAAAAPRGVARRHATTSRSATAASPSRSSATPTATAGQEASSSTSADTAGYGKGAVIALVTQAPEGKQAQYLWYSTDRGRSFRSGGDAPVLPNPGVPDFRDPKVIWDADRERWFMANAEGQKIGFYVSADLRSWQRVGQFERTDLGVLECPDIFRMTADDGSSHWILGMSANGKGRGLPATYAYWTGTFDGASFAPDHGEPQWLDYGFDFYGAVTYPHHDASGAEDATLRRAIGWANFWDYPHNTPTLATDGYNGDDMIVRDIRLKRGSGGYYLASTPTAALERYASKTHRLGDVVVSGTRDLDVRSLALRPVVRTDVGPGGRARQRRLRGVPCPWRGTPRRGGRIPARPVRLRQPASDDQPHRRRVADTDRPLAGRLKIRILVDRTSVELFVGDGRVVHSHRVFPLEGDDRIRLYAHEGQATFRGLTIRELSIP